MSTPEEPGVIIRGAFSGPGPDLAKLGIFLEAVVKGHNPADVLRELGFAAITIPEMHLTRGRGDRLLLVFRLTTAE